MQKKAAASEKAQAIAEDTQAKTLAAHDVFKQQMEGERANHANELKKFKEQVADNDKALKAINKALADTPENVMKKLRTLKKQKNEEAAACKLAETGANVLLNEKKQLEKAAKESESKILNLSEKYRELHKVTEDLHEQLKELVDDEKNLPALPEIDDELVGSSENTTEEKKK